MDIIVISRSRIYYQVLKKNSGFMMRKCYYLIYIKSTSIQCENLNIETKCINHLKYRRISYDTEVENNFLNKT